MKLSTIWKRVRRNKSKKQKEVASTDITTTKPCSLVAPTHPAPEECRLSDNEKIGLEWVMSFVHRDRSRAEAITDMASIFSFHDDAAGKLDFLVGDLYNVATNFWESFPNCGYEWETVKEVSPNVVVLEGFSWFGNHTGTPFRYDPHPSIEPVGTYIKDGPLRCEFHILDGKIVKTISTGCNSGPHGTYEKLGGILF